jgi:hypothetical protein
VEKFVKNRTSGSPNLKTEDNIKMYLQEMKCELVDWIYLTQARDPERIFAKIIRSFWSSENASSLANINSPDMTPVYAASELLIYRRKLAYAVMRKIDSDFGSSE